MLIVEIIFAMVRIKYDSFEFMIFFVGAFLATVSYYFLAGACQLLIATHVNNYCLVLSTATLPHL